MDVFLRIKKQLLNLSFAYRHTVLCSCLKPDKSKRIRIKIVFKETDNREVVYLVFDFLIQKIIF